MSEEFLLVSELNRYIRDVLNSGFPKSLWVCGEIQGYDRGKDKKHVFFELCEKDPLTNDIIARIGLVIFAQNRPRIEALLKKAENAFELKDDIEVKFCCKVDFYPGHGQIRLIVEAIDPVYTLGKIAQDRQRLIAQLKQKGILDKNKALSLLPVVLNIGLITSYDSAAYHDFMDELKRSRYGFKVQVMNTLMQGKNAENAVVKALKFFNSLNSIDVIVITRGGGSIAELSCFDSEKIALEIASSTIPVLSGIGHEINTTVTDLAAHTFAKTPTAIAKLLIDRLKEFIDNLDVKQDKVLEGARYLLKSKRLYLKDNALGLQNQTLSLIKTQQHRLVGISQALHKSPLRLLKDRRDLMNEHQIHLKKIIYLRLQNSRIKINNLEKLVLLADPKNTLKRGFSITRAVDGQLIRSIEGSKNIKVITTEVVDGMITSTIKD